MAEITKVTYFRGNFRGIVPADGLIFDHYRWEKSNGKDYAANLRDLFAAYEKQLSGNSARKKKK